MVEAETKPINTGEEETKPINTGDTNPATEEKKEWKKPDIRQEYETPEQKAFREAEEKENELEEKQNRERDRLYGIKKEGMEKRKTYAKVWFEISIDGEVAGKLDIELWDNQPKTAENFRAHCHGVDKEGNVMTY